MSVTMEQMLESVADAVSAMVIFATEAQNNTAVLRNLAAGATGVATAVNYLIAQAAQTVALWEKIGSSETARQMKEVNAELEQAVNDLVGACKELAENPKSIDAKANILEEGKAIMNSMVAVIQYNDMYDVMIGLKQVNVAKVLLDDIYEDVFPADDFIVLVSSIVTVLERRMEVCHDSRARQWLKESKEELNQLTVPLVTLVKRSWVDLAFVEKIDIVLQPYLQVIEKTIKALKLSAKSPFDLTLLDNSIDIGFRDEDLDDIVVTASDFQDALAAVRKALQEGDEFELDRAIRAIEKDIRAQLAAAEELANQITDPYLRAQLLQKIKAARDQLDDLLAKLAEEIPIALKTGDFTKVNKLMSELEKLFSHVSEELAAHEIQKAAASIEQLLKELPPAVDAEDDVEARALCKDVSKEVARQAVMAKVLAETVDDDYRRNRILNDIGELAKLSKELSSTTEDALEKVPKARAHLDEVIAELLKYNADLVTAASLSTPEELLEIGGTIDKLLNDLQTLADKGITSPADKKASDALLDSLAKNVARQTELARAWAATLGDDPDLQKGLGSAASALAKESARLEAATKALAKAKANDDLKALKDAFDQGVEKTRRANRELVGLAFESPDDQLEALQGKIASDMTRLREGVKAKHLPLTAQAIADTKKDINDLRFLGSIMAAEIEDEKVNDQLATINKQLVEALPLLLPQAKEAVADYKSNMPALNMTLNEIETLVDKVVDLSSAGSPEDQLMKNATAMSSLAKRSARDAEKGLIPKVASKMKDEERKVQKQVRLAKAVANRCEDVLPEAAKKLVDEVAKLEPLRQKMETANTASAKDTNDATLAKAMKKATQDFRDQAELTAKLAEDIKSGKAEADAKAKEAARLEEERRRREEEEREKERLRRMEELARQAAAPKGPVVKEIVEAVVLMQEETSKYTVDNTAAGSLLELANRLAIAFQQLASLAKTGTKKDIIMKAREIADIIKNIMKFIEEACANCRDPILCRELRDMGHVTLNFGTQLKIICGVKANLILEDDPDAANSLITCSRGLCKSVGEIVKLSQISKLKPKK